MYLFLVILCGFFAVITIFDAFFVTWIIYDKSKKWSLPEWFNKRSILLVIVALLTCILNLKDVLALDNQQLAKFDVLVDAFNPGPQHAEQQVTLAQKLVQVAANTNMRSSLSWEQAAY